MARVTRLVIGEDNFTETACGFCFKASVCEPDEEIDDSHIRVRRLLALFPGSTVETVLSKPAQPEEEKKPDEKAAAPKADAPAPEADAKPDTAPNAEPAAKPEAEAAPDAPEPKKLPSIGADDGEVKAKLEEAAAEDHAAKAKASDETADELPVVEGSEKPCGKCGQVDHGQRGEYPCSQCGLPTLHDEEAPEAEAVKEADADAKAPDGE